MRRPATGAAAALHDLRVALLVGLALLGLRAWPRALGPEVWQEDGVRNLAGVITDGAATLVEPVNGYLLLLPKLITWIAASVSFTHYPAISIGLGWAATLAVVVLLACAPLRLRGGVLLAAAALLVPTDAEVFGLPLYTMWWAAVALMAIVFWAPGAGGGRLRAAVIVLASLSSPACLLVLPLHWLRALSLRTRRDEVALAVLATVCAAAQLAVLTSQALPFAEGVPGLGPRALLATVPVFLGAYLSGTLAPFLAWPAGLAMLGIVVAGLWADPRNPVGWALAYLWAATVLMAIGRVDIATIHPVTAGPRYFFLPFVVSGWMLLQIAFASPSRALRWIAWPLLAASAANAVPVLWRTHEPLHWGMHVASCARFEGWVVPIQSDGIRAHAWRMPLTGEQCRRMLASDPFRATDAFAGSPFRFAGTAAEDPDSSRLATVDALLAGSAAGSDYDSRASGVPSLGATLIHGTYGEPGTQAGAVRLRLRRGDQVWYRSEPYARHQHIVIEGLEARFASPRPVTRDWTLLDFSNSALPDAFTVAFVDGDGGADGAEGRGEWSAVALRAR
jgi:hypothetical protein